MLLKRELIKIGLEGNTSEEVERAFANLFVEKKYAKESYPDAIIEREKEYPTALPAFAFDIAIPHTFAEHVNEEAMGVAVLKNPVPFKQMGSPEIELKPRILFMLAIINPKNQLNMLKKIVEIIQDNSALEKIKVAKSEDEIFDVLSSIISE